MELRMQKILNCTTKGNSLRSDIDGIGAEDGDLIDTSKEIGLSSCMRVTFYKTVMHAIADGWKLLGAPMPNTEWAGYYDWWLVK
jgi:hypothetical protein